MLGAFEQTTRTDNEATANQFDDGRTYPHSRRQSVPQSQLGRNKKVTDA
jgi:hypothetical protein